MILCESAAQASTRIKMQEKERNVFKETNVLSDVAQSCPTLATPQTVAFQAPLSMGILQARILEWVAMPSSRGSS